MNKNSKNISPISNIRVKACTKAIFDRHLEKINSKIIGKRKLGRKITYDDVIKKLLPLISDELVTSLKRESLTAEDIHFLLGKRYKKLNPKSDLQDFKLSQLDSEKWSNFLNENKDVLEVF